MLDILRPYWKGFAARLRSDLEAKTGEVNDLKRKYDDLLSQNNPQQVVQYLFLFDDFFSNGWY